MNFIMLGMGFISARHLDAIKAVGGNLLAYHDLHSVVGHVDSRFMDALYYPEFLHFDCFVDRYQREKGPIDYAVILLPNHLHNPACRWALTRGMGVIVEKPLVLYEKNLDELLEVEKRTGKKVNTILQMRLHPETQRMLKEQKGPEYKEVHISYHTPRGHWFRHDGGWKSDPQRSGGLCTAIGIHLFDLASYAFGSYRTHCLFDDSPDRNNGYLELNRAFIEWDLSVEPKRTPERTFKVSGNKYDFTNGFNDLHVESYKRIIEGKGFGIEDAREAIKICEAIRRQSIQQQR